MLIYMKYYNVEDGCRLTDFDIEVITVLSATERFWKPKRRVGRETIMNL